MAESAAKRAIRLLDLVPYLTTHQGVTVQEVAKEFAISEADVIRDLDLISMCGLPGYTPLELIELSHEDGVITVRDPQNLNSPRRFNEEEVLILQIALAALEDALPQDRRGSVSALRSKLRSIFRSQIPEAALVYEGDKYAVYLRIIEKAILQNLKVRIRYLNKAKGETTDRYITPLTVLAETKRTLIDAWCDTARARRTFNLAQIQEISITKEPGVSILSDDDPEFHVAVVSSPPDTTFVRENLDQLLKLSDNTFSIKVFQEEWLRRSVLASGGEVKVVEPAELKISISQTAKDALANYA